MGNGLLAVKELISVVISVDYRVVLGGRRRQRLRRLLLLQLFLRQLRFSAGPWASHRAKSYR